MAECNNRKSTCKDCLHVNVCIFRNAGEDEEICRQFKNKAAVVEVRHGECPICSGKKDIKQDCDNGYYVEVDREQREMSVWLGDECLAVFSIDYCPNCGAKMDGGNDDG